MGLPRRAVIPHSTVQYAVGDKLLISQDDDDIGVDSDEFDEELEDQDAQPAAKLKTPLRHTTGV